MPEINLAPAGIKGSNSLGKKYNLIALIFSTVIVAVSAIFFIIFFSKKLEAKKNYDKAKSENNSIMNEIAKMDPEGIKAFQNKVGLLAGLLDNHAYWSNLFSVLEDRTVKTVWYNSLSAETSSGAISLEAQAKNLDGAARQIVSFENEDKFSSVDLMDIGASSEGTIDFSVDIKVSDGLIKISSSESE